jgi:uncharacterized membrane protein YgcG
MNSRNFLSILALNVLFCLTAVAQNQTERIISFHTDIVIETDGTIVVTDHEKIYAAGKDIKHGIIREIPLYRKNKNGKQIKMNFDVLSVTCNGENAKYSTSESDGELAIRIGDADVFLSPGEYDYVITYSSRGHIGFFDGYDELYWNVTGFNEFIIEQASATVTLPDGAATLQTYAYTGKKDAKGQDYTVEDIGNVLVFTTTRAFAPDEGLTVSVGFTPDIIERPPPPSKTEVFFDFLLSSRPLAFIFFILTALTLAPMYFKAKRVKPGMVVPQFFPPNDWSPSEINYLHKRGYDSNTFTAAIMQMAVKGTLLISKKDANKKDGDYLLSKTSDVSRLNAEELALHNKLFESKDSIDTTSKNTFQSAKEVHKKEMERSVKLHDYWQNNIKRQVFGFLAIIFLPCTFGVIVGFDDFINSALITWPFLLMALAVLSGGGKRSLFGFAIFAVAYSASLFWGLYSENEFDVALTLYLIATGILYTVYAFSLYRPTEQGAQVLADIEGFRMYMKTAEQHRLNLLNPPEQTPEHFEKMLPYAMALGVSNQWCGRFAAILAAAQYQPAWNNEKLDNRKWRSFHRSFAKPFSSSVSRAVTYSSSSGSSGSRSWSSGSRGGGRSGGGGGGGRTRGW